MRLHQALLTAFLASSGCKREASERVERVPSAENVSTEHRDGGPPDVQPPKAESDRRYQWRDLRAVVAQRLPKCGLSTLSVAFSIRSKGDGQLYVDEVLAHSRDYSWPCIRQEIEQIRVNPPFPDDKGCAVIVFGVPTETALAAVVLTSESEFIESGYPGYIAHESFAIGNSTLQVACPTTLKTPLAVPSPY